MSSTSPEKPLILDLSKGLSLFTAIKINQQKHDGRKIIFSWHWKNTNQELLIGLNKEDNLQVWFKNNNGKVFESNSVESNSDFCVLSCEVFAKGSSLSVKIGFKNIQKESLFDVGDVFAGEVSQVVGANKDGQENAAFSLGELLVFNQLMSGQDKESIENYIINKWVKNV